MEWLWANKEWLFSGAGVSSLSLIGLVIVFVYRKFLKKPVPIISATPTSPPPPATKKEKKVSWFFEAKRVPVGDYHDFHFGHSPLDSPLDWPLDNNIRITVKEIKKEKLSSTETIGVVLKVSDSYLRDTATRVGKNGRQLSMNEFWLPEPSAGATSDNSIYAFVSDDSLFFFFSVSVAHINPHTGHIEISVVCVK